MGRKDMASHANNTESSAARLGQIVGRGVRFVLDAERGLWNGLTRLGLPATVSKLAKWATRAGLLVAAAGVSLYFLFPFFVFCFAVFGVFSVGANKESAEMAEALLSQSNSVPCDRESDDVHKMQYPQGYGYYDSYGYFHSS
jgi:hypothetical protein